MSLPHCYCRVVGSVRKEPKNYDASTGIFLPTPSCLDTIRQSYLATCARSRSPRSHRRLLDRDDGR
jgi:hypothetical protein